MSHCKLEEFYKKDVLKNCCQIFIKLLVLGSLFNKKCKVEYQADICLNNANIRRNKENKGKKIALIFTNFDYIY